MMADDARVGGQWRCENLDAVVDLRSGDGAPHIQGEMLLVLSEGSSSGPTIVVNARAPAMRFVDVSLEGSRDAEVTFFEPGRDDLGAHAQAAHVQSGSSFSPGDRVTVRFTLRRTEDSFQLVVNDDVALGSWTEQWLPGVLPRGGVGQPGWRGSRGRTSFRLPPGWRSISNGELVDQGPTDEGPAETWATEQPVARSFVAGAFQSAWYDVNGRNVGVHLLDAKPLDVEEQVEMLVAALTAQEARFGPYPYPSYSIVEIPDGVVDWYASSEQGFIMAVSKAFSFGHGNLPLWAHEMAHGWWGNLVAATGPGSLMCDEALAQYSAVVAIEAIEGEDAMREFLMSSRSGYSPSQCARGYFEMEERGEDMPLSRMHGENVWEHNLADAKGHWVYHMLRHLVGDEIFFATLRALLGTFGGSVMTLDDVRAAFVAAAPDRDVEGFFVRWLDRPGAPRLEVDWTRTPTGIALAIRQIQEGPPYPLALDIAVESSEGTTMHRVDVSEQEARRELTAGGEVRAVTVDPNHRVLLWPREETT